MPGTQGIAVEGPEVRAHGSAVKSQTKEEVELMEVLDQAKPESRSLDEADHVDCLTFAALASRPWTQSQRDHIIGCDRCKSRLKGLAIVKETEKVTLPMPVREAVKPKEHATDGRRLTKIADGLGGKEVYTYRNTPGSLNAELSLSKICRTIAT